jgi:hypothetical protein
MNSKVARRLKKFAWLQTIPPGIKPSSQQVDLATRFYRWLKRWWNRDLNATQRHQVAGYLDASKPLPKDLLRIEQHKAGGFRVSPVSFTPKSRSRYDEQNARRLWRRKQKCKKK